MACIEQTHRRKEVPHRPSSEDLPDSVDEEGRCVTAGQLEGFVSVYYGEWVSRGVAHTQVQGNSSGNTLLDSVGSLSLGGPQLLSRDLGDCAVGHMVSISSQTCVYSKGRRFTYILLRTW